MKILIDNGHGITTPGKQSPDGTHREYRWAREMAGMIVAALREQGLDAERLVPEDADISITERCRRANAWCAKLGSANVLLVSIHNNAAASDGKWHTASGFTCFVSNNASERSKWLARHITEVALQRDLCGNRVIPIKRYFTWGDMGIKADIGLLHSTHCPAILTENHFQDCKADVVFLNSESGKQQICQLHTDAIQDYLNQYARRP